MPEPKGLTKNKSIGVQGSGNPKAKKREKVYRRQKKIPMLGQGGNPKLAGTRRGRIKLCSVALYFALEKSKQPGATREDVTTE